MRIKMVGIMILAIVTLLVSAGIAKDNHDVKDNNEDHKVVVCHVPPGNEEKAHTIEIDENTVSAHMANNSGDQLGECSAVSSSDLPPAPVPELNPAILSSVGLLGIVLVSRKFRS